MLRRGFRSTVGVALGLVGALFAAATCSDSKDENQNQECMGDFDCGTALTCCFSPNSFSTVPGLGQCLTPTRCNDLDCQPVGMPCGALPAFSCCAVGDSDTGICTFETDCDETCDLDSECVGDDVCCRFPGGDGGLCVTPLICDSSGGITSPGEGGAGGSGGGGGSGGSGAAGGSGGSGGGGGTGGAGPLIPPYQVLSGTAVVDGDGCIVAGTEPVLVAFDEPIVGPVTMEAEGTLQPDPNGGPLAAVALLQVCSGGLVNGNTLEGCHLGRVSQNINTNEGVLAIFDTNFVELVKELWPPPATVNDVTVVFASNLSAETLSIDLTVDGGSPVATNASGLGTPGGTSIGLLLQNTRACRFTIVQ